MPDQKKNLSISSFKKDILHFTKICILFFIPVILVYAVLEYSVQKIPTTYKTVGKYLDNNAPDIEVAFFGSSQIKNSVNPAFIDKNSINLSSTSQHHNTDFKLLKQTRDRLSNLKVVILEISYGHFEFPHNTKYFWKNNLFLKYYDVNTFERTTYFKDRLIFLSRPGYFSKLLIDHYFKGGTSQVINEYGFDENNFKGKFKRLKYNDSLLLKSKVVMGWRVNENRFYHNVDYFYKMLEYCKKEGFKVVICSTPIFKSYRDQRNPIIVNRRDSIINVFKKEYPDIVFFNLENDTSFTAKHYKNENHLNPDGAKLFSKKLNKILNDLD